MPVLMLQGLSLHTARGVGLSARGPAVPQSHTVHVAEARSATPPVCAVHPTLRHSMQLTQLRLSVSCAGWLYSGQPGDSRPSGGSAQPPL